MCGWAAQFKMTICIAFERSKFESNYSVNYPQRDLSYGLVQKLIFSSSIKASERQKRSTKILLLPKNMT